MEVNGGTKQTDMHTHACTLVLTHCYIEYLDFSTLNFDSLLARLADKTPPARLEAVET